jgi:hypothetical protein
VAGAIAVSVAALVGWRLVARNRAIRAGLAGAEAAFVAHGFTEVASNALTGASTLEADVGGGACFVAVAAGGGPLRVRLGASTTEAAGSVGWCPCSAERVALEVPRGAGPVGLAVLGADARSVGGPLARPWLDFAPDVWADDGGECAESALDGWIADGHWPGPPLDDGWLDSHPEHAPLKRAGFRVAATVAPGRPFGVVDGAAGECFLALAGDQDGLSLRAQGGKRVAGGRGALAWCATTAAKTSVWRDGGSPVVVLRAAAVRVGGLLGTRECAEQARVPVAPRATWLSDADLAWDAGAVLRASALTDVVEQVLPATAGPPDARLVALALSPSTVVVVDPPGAVVACDPPLDAAAGARDSSSARARGRSRSGTRARRPPRSRARRCRCGSRGWSRATSRMRSLASRSCSASRAASLATDSSRACSKA